MNTPHMLKQNDRLLSYAMRSAGIVNPILRRTRETDQRTLVVRPGGMGDLVVAVAVASDLGVDASRVHWLIERRSEPWAKHLNLSYSTYDDYARAIRMHFRTQFAQVVVLEQLFGLAGEVGIALAADAGRVYGFATNRAAKRYGRACQYDPYDSHELYEFAKPFQLALCTSKSPVRYRTRLYSDHGHDVIAIAGTRTESRSLSASDWARFATDCTENAVTIVADMSDAALAREVAQKLDRVTDVLVGDFEMICERIKHARRVVSIDGGMVHVASYYGVPIEAIFTSGRELKWGPWSSGSRVHFARGMPCRPCTLFGQVPSCPNQLICKEQHRWQAQEA